MGMRALILRGMHANVCGKIEILRPVTYPPPIHTGGLLSSLKDKHARV